MSLFTQGLVISALGLCGVFLVLTLFYVSIRLMQRIGKDKKSEQ
ncbi:MAG: OadG family protein [Eubacteriales bacterium]|nr:OadG family protein [Eubacteriales bacterium]